MTFTATDSAVISVAPSGQNWAVQATPVGGGSPLTLAVIPDQAAAKSLSDRINNEILQVSSLYDTGQ